MQILKDRQNRHAKRRKKERKKKNKDVWAVKK